VTSLDLILNASRMLASFSTSLGLPWTTNLPSFINAILVLVLLCSK